jgi:hypothetical protein
MTITKIYFGAHTSIAKGVLNGLKYISDIGGNVSQIFLGNRLSSQLKSKTKLTEDEKKEIQQYLKENDHKLFVHAAYVLNLASKPPTSSSIQYQLDSLIYDLELGDEIGSSGLVIHLGNQMKLDKEEAYQNMVSCVMKVIDVSKGNGRILLETSAGAGTQIGVGLDDFAKLWNMFPKEYHSRLGVCVDTAHIFSAGIPINKPGGVKQYFEDFDKKIGLKHLHVVHLNDSKAVFNARVDRHENLEQGYIFDSQKNGSSKALQTILAFLVKHQIPALLETPGDGSPTDNESGSYQYQLQMIKDLVNDYNKLPNPSINLASKYATKFSRKLSRSQSSRFIHILKKTLKEKNTNSRYVQKGGKSAAADLEPNKSIIRLLMEMGNLLKIRKDIFRSRALQTASIILREYNEKITSSEQLKGIPRIGQGIRDKVDEYLKTGKIQDVEDLKNTTIKFKSHKTKVKDELESILGIGPSEASKFIKLGIKSIEDLKEKVENGDVELNHQQLIGLKYYKDLAIDIPRKDAHQIVLAIEKKIKTSKEHLEWKDLEIIHAGSYPSGKKASKDIDILMFDPRIKTRIDLQKSTLLIDVCNYLEKEKLILETLSLGTTKFLGVVPSSKKSNYVKHLDIRLIPTESRITAYFFYTSGGKFNQMIRQVAKDKGFMLSEFELKDKTGKTVHVESEEDIFKALGLKFIPMSDRREL